MLVGAGLRDGRGAVLRYTSPNMEAWQFRGIFAAGGVNSVGEAWECPQYVDLGTCRALVASVWDNGALTRIAAARGVERNGTFTPGELETLGHGGAAYALTTYRDRGGRLAATAWLRHDDAETPRVGWSGMLSLPVQLSARPGGGVHVAPHLDVNSLRQEPLAAIDGTVELAGQDATDGVADLEVHLAPGARLQLETTDRPVLLTAANAGLIVESATGVTRVPEPGPAISVRVVVDRGAVEAWTRNGQRIALRIPYLHARRPLLAGAGELARGVSSRCSWVHLSR